MEIKSLSWKQAEQLRDANSIAIVPLGSTEQHAYLSLATDTILATKLAIESSAGLDVAIFPCLPYGLVPQFKGFVGTISLRSTTYLLVVEDILRGLFDQGFSRIFIINGHGGNIPAKAVMSEVLNDYPACLVQWHDWWIASQTYAKVLEIDPVASHASWMENFPWTRLSEVESPKTQKPMVDLAKLRQLSSERAKEFLGDGNFGGHYQRSDEEMLEIWEVAKQETRSLITNGWAF